MISSVAWRPDSRVTVFISNSLGEIDFLLPILVKERAHLRAASLVFTSTNLHERFIQTHPLPRIVEELNVEISSLRSLSHLNALLSPSLWWRLFQLVKGSDIIQVEQNGGGAVGRMALLLSKILGRRIQIHPHATNIEVGSLTQVKPLIVTREVMLLGHEKLREVYQKQGYRHFIAIGFPKFYNSWKQMVLRYAVKPEPYVLIFTRPLNETWMPAPLYEKLLRSSVEAISKHFPDHEVVLKTHPRENPVDLAKLLEKLEFSHITISREHSMVLASRCSLAVGFFTSAIFDAYAFGKPAVDFYEEHPAMRAAFPQGRINRLLGLDTADSRAELDDFFQRVKNSTYRLPEFIRDLADT